MDFGDEDMHPSVEKFNWVVSVPIGLVICAIGLVGNLLSIIVWYGISKRQQGSGSYSSASAYLITLGVCDIGFLIFYVLAETLPAAAVELKSNYAYAAFFSWVVYPAINYFFNAGVWLVVGVTTNRFILIYFPLKGKELCSKIRTRIVITLTLFLAACVNIPHFFNFHPTLVNGAYKLKTTKYGASFHSKMFHFWMHCIILSILPWFVIATLNVLIIRKLKKQTVKFTSIRSRAKSEIQDRKMTNMLLGITFTFLLLMGFQCITQCLHKQQYRIEDEMFWRNVQRFYSLGRLALAINSAINCFFYCFSGQIFRDEVRKIMKGDMSWRTNTYSSRMSISATSNEKRKTIRKISAIVNRGSKDMTTAESELSIVPHIHIERDYKVSESEISVSNSTI